MKITLAVTAYNDEKILSRFFEHHKDYFDEIVASDDCSSDRTPEIIQKYADKYLLSNKRYMACEFYRDKIANLSSNDWVFMLDSDQFIDFSYIDKLRDLADNAEKEGKHVLSINIPPKRIGCSMCLPGFNPHREPKFVNKKYIRWSVFPHCGMRFKESNQQVHASNIIGDLWHLCPNGNLDLKTHTINRTVKQWRWIDYAKWCLETFNEPMYLLDREKCIKVYKEAGFDLLNIPYQMSRSPDKFDPLCDREAFEFVSKW